MFTILDYSSALEYSIIRRYTNIVYYYYYYYYKIGMLSGYVGLLMYKRTMPGKTQPHWQR